MVHLSRLRSKLEASPKEPKYLITIRGVGYKLNKIEPCKSDMSEIDVMPVTEHGGSVAAVDQQGHITTLCGDPLFDKPVVTMKEWTDFLTSCSDPAGRYSYTVAFEETQRFWLVVGFPSAVRIQFVFAANPQAENFKKSVLFFSILLLLLLFLLLISTFFYARFSAKTFISPLRQLCGMTKRMTHGNYLEDTPTQSLTGEFLWLKNDITALAKALIEEKAKREQMQGWMICLPTASWSIQPLGCGGSKAISASL